MPFFETRSGKSLRMKRQKKLYPELEQADFTEIAELDAFSRARGGDVSRFGSDVESSLARVGVPEEEQREIEFATRPPRIPGFGAIGGGSVFGGIGGPPAAVEASERLAFDPEEVGIRETTPEEELRTAIGRQRDQLGATRGLEQLPGIEALEEFEPFRRDPGQPRPVERDVGIQPAISAAQTFDEITGLPVRAALRHPGDFIDDFGAAGTRQRAEELEGGLGFGLEGSGIARILEQIPGFQSDIPGTGLSGFDITLGMVDIFADIGGVYGAAKAPASALGAATRVTGRGATEAAVEAGIRQADPTAATRAAGEIARGVGVPSRPAISLGQASDELLIMRVDGNAAEMATRGSELLDEVTTEPITGPRRLFHVEPQDYTAPTPVRGSYVETVEEAVALNRADFAGNGRILAVDIPDGVTLPRVEGRLSLDGELSSERIAGEIRVGPPTDTPLFGERALGPNDVMAIRNPQTGQITIHPRLSGAGPSDLDEAQDMARRALESEQALKATRQAELDAGRAQQAAAMNARRVEGETRGLEGTELREFVDEGARTGPFERTAGAVVEWTPLQRNAIDQQIVDVIGRGNVAPQVQKSVTEAVNRIQYGRGLRAFELDPTTSTGRMLREVLGDDAVEAAARNMPLIPSKPGILTPNARTRPLSANQIRAGQSAVRPPRRPTRSAAARSIGVGPQRVDPIPLPPPSRANFPTPPSGAPRLSASVGTTRSPAARQVARAGRQAATEARQEATAARRQVTATAREARRSATNAPRAPRRGPPRITANVPQNAPLRATPANLAPSEPRIRAAIRQSRLARAQVNQPPSFLGRFGQELLDFTGLPRAIKASFDISAPLRQGALFIRRGEWWRAWEPMIHALRSDDFARGLQDELIGGPKTAVRAAQGDEFAAMAMDSAARADAAGLDLTMWGNDFIALSAREESFSTKWADRIPGMRASERAYATFLNKLRRDIFDNYADKMDNMLLDGSLTRDQHEAELREMARWLNIGTGRADLPERMATSDLMVAANRTFFSPRLNIARVQTFGEAFRVLNLPVEVGGRNLNPVASSLSIQMRGEIAKDIVGFVGAGVGALALMHELGWIDVELDPRSSDFGKGVTQNGERLDSWGGFQQIARYTAQIISNQRKAADGEIEEFEGGRDEPFGRFLRSKLDPGVPGLLVDLLTGHTFMGDEVVPTNAQELGSTLADRFAPLSVVDIIEGAKADGLLGAVRGSGSQIGLGYAQYLGYGDVLDQIAREYSGTEVEIAGELVNFPSVDSIDELPKGFKDIVKADERAIAKLAELEDEPEDLTRDQTSFAFDQHETNMTTLETGLKKLLDDGVAGESRREAISDFKSDRWIASSAIFDGQLSEELEQGRGTQATIDIGAEAYWSAPVKQTVTELGDVHMDYDERDVLRDEILEQITPALEALGLTTEYITGSGVGTYRGDRFDDPAVREAVLEQEAFEGQLRDTGLFDLKDVAWLSFREDEHPNADWTPEQADYWGWRDIEVMAETQALIDEGENPQAARENAEAEVAGYATISQFNEYYRKQFRHEWVTTNPQLALRAWSEGWFSPDKAERGFLSELE